MAMNQLTPEQWKQAGGAKPIGQWMGLEKVSQPVEAARVAAEKEFDEAPVNIAKQLTASRPIDES